MEEEDCSINHRYTTVLVAPEGKWGLYSKHRVQELNILVRFAHNLGFFTLLHTASREWNINSLMGTFVYRLFIHGGLPLPKWIQIKMHLKKMMAGRKESGHLNGKTGMNKRWMSKNWFDGFVQMWIDLTWLRKIMKLVYKENTFQGSAFLSWPWMSAFSLK